MVRTIRMVVCSLGMRARNSEIFLNECIDTLYAVATVAKCALPRAVFAQDM